MNDSWLIGAILLLLGGGAGFVVYECLIRSYLPSRQRKKPTEESRSSKKKRDFRLLRTTTKHLERWLPMGRADSAASRDLLMRAGWIIEPETWRGIRILGALVGGLAIGGPAIISGSFQPMTTLGLIVIFVAVGWIVPRLILARATARRLQAIDAQLPDAMELLGIAVAAGSPIEQCFREVAANLSEPLSLEFAMVDREVNLLGHTREQALLHLSERCVSKDVAVFVAQFTQAVSQGTSVAEGLASQAALAHETAQARSLERIRKMPTKLDLVLSFCFLPPTIALVIVPTAVTLLKFLNDTLQ